MKTKRVSKFLLLVPATLSLLLIVQCVSNLPGVKSALAMATTVKPEAFTELYFENHTSLPKTIRPGAIYSFSFTIHNLESKTVDYTYLVYVVNGDQTTNIDLRTVTLKNDEFKTIQEKFGPLDNFHTLVAVELMGKSQKIDFLMNAL